jgi:RNA polymerase sigma-70 factor, ECF subfamily
VSRKRFHGIFPSLSAPETEEDLVIRVQRGELAAFERLLELHSSHLRAFVAMKLPVPHLIDEIAHEAFVFAHRHIQEFRPGTDFGKWLRAIAFNLIRKETLRHQRLSKNREKFLEHHLVQEATRGEFTPDLPLVSALEECLSRLPEQQRRLLERKYTLSESSREIATAFGQSEAWVRTTLCRVRTSLRQCMEHKINGAPGTPEPA